MNRTRIAAAVIFCGLAGTTLALWRANAEDKPATATKAEPKRLTLAETTAILQKPAAVFVQGQTVEDILSHLEKSHGVAFILDPVIVNAATASGAPHEKRLAARNGTVVTVQDVLLLISDGYGIPDLGVKCLPGRILITRTFQTMTTPGQHKVEKPQMLVHQLAVARSLCGPTVHIAIHDRSLAEFVALLREQTGENIVLDPRMADQANKKLTLTFTDAKLRTVLSLAANFCDLDVAVVDNVFLITDPENAKFQNDVAERNLFGERE